MTMSYEAALALGVSLGVSISTIVTSLSMGKAAAAAMEAIARQPDAAGNIRTLLLITLALIEALVLYCLLVFILLQGKLAPVAEVVKITAGGM
ncbi:MAG: ATP synthase F0 subunit C [candidate division WS1 bacterium]|nr:ATP synthase F0 subunit C [candidate division WS1 bacterium]